nr:M12 family metallo-peptidase [uncultured Methanoregula sp.]
MKQFKWGIVLLAVLLAVMAMVPIVSAGDLNKIDLHLQGTPYSPVIRFDGLSTIVPQTTTEKTTYAEISPSIKKYDVINIDVKTLKKQLLSGQKIPIHLKDTSYLMNLHEETFYPSAETGVFTFTGHLENSQAGTEIPDSEAHLTMDDTGVIGKISVTPSDYYLIDEFDQMDNTRPAKTLQYVYSSKDVEPSKMHTGEDGIFVLPSGKGKVYSQLTPEEIDWIKSQQQKNYKSKTSDLSTVQQDGGIRSPADWVDVNLLVLCDNQMYTGYSNWIKRAQSLVADANTAMAFNYIKIRLVPTYDATQRTILSNNFDLTRPVLSFHDLVPTSYLDTQNADIAMFLCSRQFNAGNGVIGQSTVFDNPNSSYHRHATIMYEAAPGWGYYANPQERAAVFTHEIGHLFDADAQGAGENPSIQLETYNRAISWTESGNVKYSVMWQGALADPNYFSSPNYHGDALHDNARRLSETKDTVAGYR